MSERPSRLACEQLLARKRGQAFARQIAFQIRHLAKLLQEPGIDGGDLVDLFHASSPVPERSGYSPGARDSE